MSTSEKKSRKARHRLPEIVGKNELADFLDISPRHVQRLAAAGVLVRTEEGFDFALSVRGHLAHQEESARRRHGNGAEAALRDSRTEAIRRRLEREDRREIATVEAVDGIDLVVGIFGEALDEIAARLARYNIPDAAPVLADVRRELAEKRDEAFRQLTRG